MQKINKSVELMSEGYFTCT